jgi:hypothetical protein
LQSPLYIIIMIGRAGGDQLGRKEGRKKEPMVVSSHRQ